MTKLKRRNVFPMPGFGKHSFEDEFDEIFKPFDRMFGPTNQWFNQWLETAGNQLNNSRYPIQESTDPAGNSVLSIDVPGCSKEDLEVSYEDEKLSVRSIKEDQDGDSYPARQIQYTVSWPNVDEDSIEATCENGVLTLVAKPLGEKETAKKIPVK